MDHNRFNEVLASNSQDRAPAGTNEDRLTQQHQLAAPAENMNHPLARYAVTIKVTVETLSADEAAHIVRGFFNDVFAPSEHKVGKVHAAKTEPPCDETWLRAIDCAGALG